MPTSALSPPQLKVYDVPPVPPTMLVYSTANTITAIDSSPIATGAARLIREKTFVICFGIIFLIMLSSFSLGLTDDNPDGELDAVRVREKIAIMYFRIICLIIFSSSIRK
jgi:hypothetical protein